MVLEDLRDQFERNVHFRDRVTGCRTARAGASSPLASSPTSKKALTRVILEQLRVPHILGEDLHRLVSAHFL